MEIYRQLEEAQGQLGNLLFNPELLRISIEKGRITIFPLKMEEGGRRSATDRPDSLLSGSRGIADDSARPCRAPGRCG